MPAGKQLSRRPYRLNRHTREQHRKRDSRQRGRKFLPYPLLDWHRLILRRLPAMLNAARHSTAA
jgi:hypothetical protein